jgi:hypothetical protein
MPDRQTMSLDGAVLALNGGSSSLEFAVFDPAGSRLLSGKVERLGQAAPGLRVGDAEMALRSADRRTNDRNLHARGYKEDGATTPPFEMCVQNQIDRFNLLNDVAARVPAAARWADGLRRFAADRLAEQMRYIREHGIDLPQVRNWAWDGRGQAPVGSAVRDTAADQ